MFNKKTGIAAAALLLLLLWMPGKAVSADAAENVPNVIPEMLTADFWIDKLPEPDQVIMDGEEIASFNRDIIRTQPELIYDLTDYPASLNKERLTKLVTMRPFPDEDRYSNGRLVDWAYYQNLKEQMNLPGIGEKNEVAYGVTVRRTNIRTFPTSDESLSEPDDKEFDLFQETAAGPAEPVLVLHHSLDGGWCFVQIYNYCGWMPAADIAVAKDKESWLAYVKPSEYLVVTGNRLGLGFPGPLPVELTMGTKVPLAGGREKGGVVPGQAKDYEVLLPVRGANGELLTETALIPGGADVSIGYLSYTRANIIRQAFKILGERYGWGGMFNARDCSAFVMDVYKSFGLMLPRNGDEQERSAGVTVSFEDLSTRQRYELLDTLLPGASLHTPTHELLYLGRHEGLYYVIHDITSYGDASRPNPDGTLGKIVLNRVAVTDLSLPRRNGMLFIDSLTGGKQIQTRAGSSDSSSDYNVSVYLNGTLVDFPDQKPFIDVSADRVFVPVRFVSEALGAQVEWVREEQKILINKDGKQIALYVGRKEVFVDGRKYTLDVAVRLVNGRTMVPLRFVSEALGAGVKWTGQGSGGRVDITG
ncbi:stalk domain-containing protein [Pelotomaculum propionicicum]|uniref:Protease inhibitor n=1 Tax=Pelotomaculum propionicicum TaxID=258475 RepID=A0A4Y7RQZ6_9FIRM|nr:stalk domain-containing protein [Pelotomaculum propionicicum]TEB11283.1 Protease inhibitor [Pelotomaculum propionicicum]